MSQESLRRGSEWLTVLTYHFGCIIYLLLRNKLPSNIWWPETVITVLSFHAVSMGQILRRLSWEVLTWEFLRGCIQVSAGVASSEGP